MPKAEINGIELYYEVHGEGFPIVLSHGFSESSLDWEEAGTISALSKKYRTITYDCRGQGLTESPSSPSDYSIEIFVEDLYQLLKHLKVEEAYVGGLSMGGTISLHFTLAHPEMVRALIVASMGTGFTKEERRAYLDRLEARAKQIETEGFFGRTTTLFPETSLKEKLALTRKMRPDLVEKRRNMLLKRSKVGWANTTKALASTPPWSINNRLSEITVRTLIIAGENDEMFFDSTKDLHEGLPNSERVVIRNVGHFLHKEKPETFNSLVLSFLKKTYRS